MSVNLPQDWELAKLEDVVDILDGMRVPINAEERSNRQGEIPYYGATGQVGWIDKYLFDEELVLLGEDGAPFLDHLKQKAYIIRGKSWVNNHAHVLRACNDIPSAYLKYYLDIVDYRHFVTGTTRLKLNQGAMRKIEIPIAPIEQQKRIVTEIEKQFSRLDKAVTNLQRVKANLKRYKAAVLKAAVEGKLTEEWRKQNPDVEPASKLLKRIFAERRSKWEEAELAKMKANGKYPRNDKWKKKYKDPNEPELNGLPAIPNTWRWSTVDQTADVQLGKMLDKKKHIEGRELSYLRNFNVRWGTVDSADLRKMFFKDSELDRYAVHAGDVLVCEGGEPGRAAVWEGEIPGMMYQKALHRVRFFSGYTPQLLIYLLEYLAKNKSLDKAFTGSTINHFTRESFAKLPMPVIPMEEHSRIVEEVERNLSIIQGVEVQINRNLDRAERLRQSILQKAFSGELVHAEPTDEPASMLLERIRKTTTPTKRKKERPSAKRKISADHS